MTSPRNFLKHLFARSQPPALSNKTLVLFGDGRVAMADSADHAQALVMNDCITSGKMVFADFRPATQAEVAAMTKP